MESEGASRPNPGQGQRPSHGHPPESSRGRGRGRGTNLTPGHSSIEESKNVSVATTVIPSTVSSNLPSTSSKIVEVRPALPARFVGRGRGVISSRLLPSPGLAEIPESSGSENPALFKPICPPSKGSPEGVLLYKYLHPLSEETVCPTLKLAQKLSSVSIQESKAKHDQPEEVPKFSNLNEPPIINNEPVIRKGIKGKPVKVSTNYVRLSLLENKGYFEYKVEFEPEILTFTQRKRIISSLQDYFGPARTFDGTLLNLPHELPEKYTVLSSTMVHPESKIETRFLVKITFIKRQSMGNSVQFYNILFRRFMSILGMVEMGRNFFDPRKTFMAPEHRLEIWPGMVTAVEEYEGGLMLQCDSSFRVLSTQTVLNLLHEIRQFCPPGQNYKEMFQSAILNKVVLTRYNNRSYRIDDVAWDQTPLSTFNKGGENVTFDLYFKTQYKIQIENLEQPLLISRPKKRVQNIPTKPGATEVICLIPELCFSTGLTEEILTNFSTMKEISRYTRLAPTQRYASVQKFLENMKANQEITNLLRMWGLQIEDCPLDLDARVISAPNIRINDKYMLEPATHDFSQQIMSTQIMEPKRVEKWAVICQPFDLSKAERFVSMYRRVALTLGILITSTAEIIPLPSRSTDKVGAFNKAIASYLNPHVQFIVIILPTKRQDIYGAIKRYTLTEKTRPIPTQMILSTTLTSEKRLRAIVTKIALQVNCKLGGHLWSLQIPLAERIMFVGMDVYHDPKKGGAKGSSNCRESCMAMVATMNGSHSKFFSRVIFQRAGQETGDSIGSSFSQALAAFLDENGALPDRIIVFRDGVGDGQMELVKEHEISQFLKVIDFMMKMKKPKFTFVIIQKRIHTRIFVSDSDRDGAKRRENFKSNPAPGTVVDHTVTRRYLFDFFLVSQFVREGTVTPSHYVVLESNNENAGPLQEISPDLIQKFAFACTFMYFNWAGSVRVPAVCQYAHKLAYLVGEHLDGRVPSEDLAHSLYFL